MKVRITKPRKVKYLGVPYRTWDVHVDSRSTGKRVSIFDNLSTGHKKLKVHEGDGRKADYVLHAVHEVRNADTDEQLNDLASDLARRYFGMARPKKKTKQIDSDLWVTIGDLITDDLWTDRFHRRLMSLLEEEGHGDKVESIADEITRRINGAFTD
jgi:hypothetical protein